MLHWLSPSGKLCVGANIIVADSGIHYKIFFGFCLQVRFGLVCVCVVSLDADKVVMRRWRRLLLLLEHDVRGGRGGGGGG